ncbi:hypothetical protein [Treponema parvum]|uniref:hypothetical protein n=1 Tax=Treponema parvum TaxID=138851 RepID=UPI001AEC69D4|nr:hypothetical protein [Treponema parvum]QTQ16872.1 hypothetical protein HXT04_09320 [Treponema parvum]
MRPDIFSNKQLRRIAKVSSRSISSFNWLLPYFVLPWRAKTFKTSWKYIGSVIKNFFVLQFFQKWGFYHIPVVNVESPLDDTVPFIPGKIDIYMHFVNFWLSPLSMLIQRFGAGRSLPFAKEFVEYITKAYNEAARVYKFRLTTTNRPDYRKNAKFKNIHNLDPHYLCVPSLHVAIAVLCFSYYKMLFERENFTEREKEKWNKELYEGAVAITESVLFVKQHSVNCIPAALYMMSHITDFFTTDDAVNFINDLFKNTPELTGENRRAVIEHIHYMYERLILEGCHEDDWAVPVQRWIVSHAKATGQDKTKL